MNFFLKNSILVSLTFVSLCTAYVPEIFRHNVYQNNKDDMSYITADAHDYNIPRDAVRLQNAIRGSNKPNIKQIINILTHRQFEQRMAIVKYLNRQYNINLLKELKILPQDISYLLTAIIKPLPLFNSNEFYKTWLPNLANESNILYRMLNILTSKEINIISNAYERLKSNSEKEIIRELQNGYTADEYESYDEDFSHFDEAMEINPNEEHVMEISQDFYSIAEIINHALYAPQPNIDVLKNVLRHRNPMDIANIVNAFRLQYGKNLAEAIEENLHGTVRHVFMALLAPQPNFNKIWLISNNMPSRIFNIIVRTSQQDLETIHQVYKQLLKKLEFTLQSLVQYDMLEENYIDAINALLEEDQQQTEFLNCNENPKNLVTTIYQATYDRRLLEATLIKVFTTCNHEQRMIIADDYLDEYNIDLAQQLSQLLVDDNLRSIVTTLMTPFPKFSSENFYKYLLPHIKNPKAMLKILNNIPVNLQETMLNSFEQIMLKAERTLLTILKYHLWLNNDYERVQEFIENLQKVFGLKQFQNGLNFDPVIVYADTNDIARKLFYTHTYNDILAILETQTLDHRCAVVKAYKQLYNKDLISTIISKIYNRILQDAMITYLTPFEPVTISTMYDIWQPSVIESNSVLHNIKENFADTVTMNLNEQLKLNIDSIILAMLKNGMNIFMEDEIMENKSAGIFDPARSAKKLAKSLENLNEFEILSILSNCTYDERTEISKAFKYLFGTEYLSQGLNQLPKELALLVDTLMLEWPELYASEIYYNSKEATIETLFGSWNKFENPIRKAFQKLYPQTEVETIMRRNLPQITEDLMNSLLKAKQKQNEMLNPKQAANFFNIIYNLDDQNLPKHGNELIAIVSTNSDKNLYKMMVQFKKQSEDVLEKSLQRLAGQGDIYKVIADKLLIVYSPFHYYAQQLHDVLESELPCEEKDRHLRRIIVGHAGTDLADIKNAFENKYGFQLASKIREQDKLAYRETYAKIIEAASLQNEPLDEEGERVNETCPEVSHQAEPHDPQVYATNLHNALLEADKKSIATILSSCDSKKISDISLSFREHFGKDLLDEIIKAFSADGPYLDILRAYLTELPAFNTQFSLNNWNSLGKTSDIIQNILNSTQNKQNINFIQLNYENLKENLKKELSNILQKYVQEGDIEKIKNDLKSDKNQKIVDQSTNNSFDIKTDVQDLSKALNAPYLDTKAIVEILSQRPLKHRIEIDKEFKNVFSTSLYDQINNSQMNKTLTYIILALLTPVPIIDNELLFENWLPQSERSSDILDTVFKHVGENQMQPVNEACYLFKDQIEQNLVNKLQNLEQETFENAQYDSKLYAYYLSKGIEQRDQIRTSEILTKCNPKEIEQVANVYKVNYGNNLLDDISNGFKADTSFHDTVLAYLTTFPEFNTQFSLDDWIPTSKRSKLVNDTLKSSEADIKLLNVTYEKLQMYVNSFLREIINKHWYKGQLEGSFPNVADEDKETQENEETFDVAKDVQDLNMALNAPVMDTKTLVNILINRSSNQRLKINQEFEKVFDKSLYEKISTSTILDEKIRDPILALLSPFPVIDKLRLFETWIPANQRLSNILDNVFKYISIQMKPLNAACNLLQEKIEQKLIVNLVKTEAQIYKTSSYNPPLYAYHLQNALEKDDKQIAADILTLNKIPQLPDFVKFYNENTGNNLITEVDRKFNNSLDAIFHDVLIAYLTSLPEFNSTFSLDNWIPKAERSNVINDIINSIEADADVRVMQDIYENVRQYTKHFLLDILEKRLYEENIESLYPLIEENNNRTQVQEVNDQDSFNASKDARDLKKALDASVVDTKAIVNILTNRQTEQRLVIAKKYEQLFGAKLSDVITKATTLDQKRKDLLVALLRPLPVIDNEKIFNTWMPKTKRSSKIIETLTKYIEIQMKPVHEAGNLLNGQIDQKLISSLRTCESKAYQKAEYEPSLYAYYLNNAIEGADKIIISEILAKCNPKQLHDVSNAYKMTYGKELIDDISNSFKSDATFHDIIEAFLTPFPHINTQFSLNDWILSSERSNVVNQTIASSQADIQVLNVTYENYKMHLTNVLSEILNKHLYDEDQMKEWLASMGTEDHNQMKAKDFNISFNVTKDAYDLYKAFNDNILDSRTIVDIIINRNIKQRLEIEKKFKEISNSSLREKIINSELNEIRRDSILALLKPFPVIDEQKLFQTWIPQAKRSSKIFETILQHSAGQTKTLKYACDLLWQGIEQKLISTLKQHETEAYKTSQCDANLYAYYLHNVINTEDKDITIKIIARCNSQQLSDVFKAYKTLYGKELLFDISEHFKTDSEFHDILMAYLTKLPDLITQFSLNEWLPCANRSKLINETVDFSESMKVLQLTYDKLQLNVNSFLLEMLTKRLYEGDLKANFPLLNKESDKEIEVNENDVTFNVTKDVQNLITAFDAPVVDTKTIVDILNNHSLKQRLDINVEFKKPTGISLYEKVNSTQMVDENVRDLILALLRPFQVIDNEKLLETWLPTSKRLGDIIDVVSRYISIEIKTLKEEINLLKQQIEKKLIAELRQADSEAYKKVRNDPKVFAYYLHNAIKAVDKPLTSDIFTTCKAHQIPDALKIYKENYKSDFITDLSKSFNNSKDGAFHDILKAYLTTLPDFNIHFSLNNWLPKRNRSNVIYEIMTALEADDDVKVMQEMYDNLKMFTKSFLWDIMEQRLYEDSEIERVYPLAKGLGTDIQMQEPDSSTDPIKDAKDLSKALKADVVDTKAIVDLIAQRSIKQRMDLAKAYEQEFGMTLHNAIYNTKQVEERMRDLLVALLTPFPEIENLNLFNTWMPYSNRSSKILDTIAKYMEIQMKPLRGARNVLNDQIEQKLISTLKTYESEAYRNAEYDPKLYGYYLHNGIEAENRIVISELLTKCNSKQLSGVLQAYKLAYGKEMIDDISNHFKSATMFHDVVVAFLSSFPDITTQFTISDWIPPSKRSIMINETLASSEADIEVLNVTYANYKCHVTNFLSELLNKHLSEDEMQKWASLIKEENKSQVKPEDSTISFNTTQDAYDLNKAFNDHILDTRTIVDIITNRNIQQRLEIDKKFKEISNSSLSDKIINTELIEIRRDPLLALLQPFPTIDEQKLFETWLPHANRSSKIFDAILQYSAVQTKTLKDACDLLWQRIERKLITTLEHHEIKAYKNTQYDAKLYAYYLHNFIDTEDKIITSKIIARCNPQQLSDVATAYKTNYGKELRSDISEHFKPDSAFHDILMAYLTKLPDLDTQFSLSEWLPCANRSKVLNETVDFLESMKVLQLTYDKLQMNVNSFLLEILTKHLYEGDLKTNFPLLYKESANETELNDIDITFNVTKDVLDLKTAFDSPVVDTKTIVDILSNRSLKQRLDINMKYKKSTGLSLYHKVNSTLTLNETVRDLILALLRPFPVIDNEKLFDSWIPTAKRVGGILDVVFRYIANEIKTLKEESNLLKQQIEEILIARLRNAESETFKKLRCDPNVLAYYLNYAIKVVDQQLTTEIFGKCRPHQIEAVFKSYEENYKNDFISDLNKSFNTTKDGAFHDIVKAYVGTLPDFNSLYSLNSWIPKMNRSIVIKDIMTDLEADEDVRIMSEMYDNLKFFTKNFLLDILEQNLYEDSDIAKVYPLKTIEKNQLENKSNDSVDVTKEVKKLSKAINATVLDTKTIVDVITQCNQRQRLYIDIKYKQEYGSSLYDAIIKIKMDQERRDLLLALLKPLPVFDSEAIFNYWMPLSNRSTQILDTIFNHIKIQMHPINGASELVKNQIESKLKSTLQHYENEAYKNAKYDADLFAYYLFNSIRAGNKIVTSEILTKCNQQQLMEVANAYKNLYEKDLNLDITEHFKTDTSFRDVLLAYLTSLPNLSNHFSLNKWIPTSKRSEIVKLV